VFLHRTVIHEFGVREVRVTDRRWYSEVRLGIGVMHSSCASLSCHLNTVDVTFWNSPVMIREQYTRENHLFSTVSGPSGLDCLLPREKAT